MRPDAAAAGRPDQPLRARFGGNRADRGGEPGAQRRRCPALRPGPRGCGGAAPGPFVGVPLVLKDAGHELEGTPHWVGTLVLHRLEHRSPATTALAATFERLGFVIVGKTNLPELSAGATTEPAEFGLTRNPWAPTRTAGGSSGGSAAVVAARLVAVAHGSDGTGSLRFPGQRMWCAHPQAVSGPGAGSRARRPGRSPWAVDGVRADAHSP